MYRRDSELTTLSGRSFQGFCREKWSLSGTQTPRPRWASRRSPSFPYSHGPVELGQRRPRLREEWKPDVSGSSLSLGVRGREPFSTGRSVTSVSPLHPRRPPKPTLKVCGKKKGHGWIPTPAILSTSTVYRLVTRSSWRNRYVGGTGCGGYRRLRTSYCRFETKGLSGFGWETEG